MRYFLGIDGGGTKTASVILDEKKRELGRGIGGPCNIATCDDAALATSVKHATESALGSAGLPPNTRFAGACAGVAGYTAKKRRSEFERILAESVAADSHHVEPDYLIAYWGATEGRPGIIVIAGTGTAVFGRNEKGESARADGRGYILGDHGSAYSIGVSGLQSTMAAADRGMDFEGFHSRLLAEIGCQDPDDVVEWVYRGFSPARIAELARPIGQWAEEGDELAAKLIRMAGLSLASSVELVKDRLSIPLSSIPISLLGGLWQSTPRLKEEFQRALATFYEGELAAASPRIEAPRHDAAFGAALLAVSSPA